MISTVLAVVADIAVCIYLLGAAWTAYRAVRVAPAWLREHPRSLGGPARRALTVAGLVPLWPLALLTLGWVAWHERHRCPLGECALWGWRTPGTPTRAPIGIYRCPHHPPAPLAPTRALRAAQHDGPGAEDQEDSDAPAPGWYITSLSCAGVVGVGALAAIPIPDPGYLAVGAAVAFASTEPLEVIFRELLVRGKNNSNSR